MARPAHAYPQVALTAADLVDVRVVSVPAATRVAEALRRARRHAAGVLALDAGPARFVLPADLARAESLGLERLPAAALARPLPIIAAGASEIAARRRRAGGAPLTVVTDRGRPIGALSGSGERQVALPARRARVLPEETRSLLAILGEIAAAHGVRAVAVGGLVRALMSASPGERRDLDVAVEGDGVAIARALAERIGGTLLEHPRFLTASVAGTAAGRIDIATCRSERYDVPGALPRVMPAGIDEDLRRRDFTVNAMALELSGAISPAAWILRDPLGGLADLARRRLRVLHPLSFVEDPTRIFRAARYAARLGFGLDAWTARCQALALRLGPYPALSGDRVAAELELILADARPVAALLRLGRAGAFRLLDPRYRFTRRTARLIAGLLDALDWARDRGVGAVPLELAALALAADQPRDVALAMLRRLAFVGEPLARLERALESGRTLAARVTAAASEGERARVLGDRSGVELAWLRLGGDRALRAHLEWFLERARHVRPALRGDDVIALGVPRGPAVARVLAGLRDARLEGRIAERAGETDFVRAWVRRGLTTGKEG